MRTELPIEPAVDSPVFRASLTALDAKASAIRKTCKNALQAAQAVHELLDKLEVAESELFDTLDTLKRHIVPKDTKGTTGLDQAGSGDDVVRDLKAWKMNERTEERQRLDTLVTCRVRALRADMKLKGIGGGGTLSSFEEQTRAYYQGLGKFLAPQSSTRNESRSGDVRQVSAEIEFNLRRYDTHSQLLWATPPYSPSCIDLATCLDIWLGGILPETMTTDATIILDSPVKLGACPPELARSPRSARGEGEVAQGAPFSGTRRRLRTLSQKASMTNLPTVSASCSNLANLVIQPLKSPPAIKEQLRQELSVLAQQKAELERAWAEREHRRRQLSDVMIDARQQADKADADLGSSKRQSLQLNRHDALAKLHAIDEAESSHTGSAANSKKKKNKGMGQRLRGIIQSASFSANLSSKAVNEPTREPSETSARPRESIQLDVPLAISPTPSRPQADKRHSFTANSSSRRESYSSPFLPSPILPTEGDSLLSNNEAYFPYRIQTAVPVETTGSRNGTPATPVYRDLQSRTGTQVMEDETHRESAGRKREGMLWTTGVWEDVSTSGNKAGDRKERGKWEHCWVVLAGCKLYEYRDALSSKPELDHEVIDLQFANARQGRDTERRFTFEIVTPKHGKRMYQTTSHEDMKSWIYAICNAVESNINGTGSLSRAGTFAGNSSQSPLSHSSASSHHPSGLGLGLPSSSRTTVNETTNTVPIDSSWAKAIERRTSFKDALRHGRASLGLHSGKLPDDLANSKWLGHKRGSSRGAKEIHHGHTHSLDAIKTEIPRSRSSLSVPGMGVGFLNPSSRQSSRSSKASKRSSLVSISDEGVLGTVLDPPGRPADPVPFPSLMKREGSFYQLELDDDMRNAVLSVNPMVTSPTALAQPLVIDPPDLAASETMTQEKFHQALANVATPSAPADMALLRRIADLPSNQTCSDCGHPIKGETSQRWATISIHNNPQVLFLCIRCAGVHRSFGTHISKVRSPDLDKWSDEAILTARSWGNARGNQIWERCKPAGEKPRDDSLDALREYIENKYVKGLWLSDEDRQFYMNEQAGIAL